MLIATQGGGYYKGFTLIELLAIIIILAIIAVITVPIILNIINDAQKNASIDSAYGYKSALEKYYMKKVVENTENELPNGYKEISDLPDDFTVSGESPSDGWVKLNKGIVEEYSLKYDEYVVTKYKDKDVKVSKRVTLASTIPIPDEYKEVEYLESTGTQYIEIPYIVSDNSKITCDAQFTSLDSNLASYFGGNDTSKWFYAGYSGTENSFITSRGCTYSQTDDWSLRTLSTFISDERYGASSIYLFARKIQTIISKSKAKIYECKFYEDNILVKNLVPVVRESDNKPGMLDLSNYSSNLFDINNNIEGYYIDSLGTQKPQPSSFAWSHSDYIEVKSNTDYSFNVDTTSGGDAKHCFYDENKNFISCINSGSQIFATPLNTKYVRFSFRSTTTEIMLNEGSTALPYEPYKKSFYTNEGTGEFTAGPEL